MLGHGKVVRPGLCAGGNAQKVIIRERGESLIIISV